MMSEDPRWQQALKHLRQAEAAYEQGDSEGMTRGCESLCAVLDSLALDPAVARSERQRAAKLLEKIDAQLRAHLPALLKRVAELSETATDAKTRAEFAALLAHATWQLPAASSARH